MHKIDRRIDTPNINSVLTVATYSTVFYRFRFRFNFFMYKMLVIHIKELLDYILPIYNVL